MDRDPAGDIRDARVVLRDVFLLSDANCTFMRRNRRLRQSQRVENACVEIVAREQSVKELATPPVLARFLVRRQVIWFVSLDHGVERSDLMVDLRDLINECLATSLLIILLAP